MKRKEFLIKGSLSAAGMIFIDSMPAFSRSFLHNSVEENDLYKIFQNPDNQYRPFVRWWWNGNKINKTENK